MGKYMREASEADTGKDVVVSNTGDGDWVPAFLDRIIPADREGKRYLAQVDDKWGVYRYASVPNYLQLHQDSGLKVGDWVKITRAAVSRESGWNALWNNKMNAFIGSIVQITTDLGEHGFKIGGAGEWNYPYFVLEKVTHRPATEADKKCTVIWNKFPDDQFTLHCVFVADDLYARAVIQNCDSGKRYSEGFQFAFLDDLSISLESPPAPEPDPQPPIEPAPVLEPWEPKCGDWVKITKTEAIQFAWDRELDHLDGEIHQITRISAPNGEYERGYQVREIDGSSLWLAREWISPAPEPVAEPEPEPQPIPEPGPERPDWLPPGARILGDYELIERGDRYRYNDGASDSHVVGSIGKTVRDARDRWGYIQDWYRPAPQVDSAPAPQRPDWLPEELKEIPYWLPTGYRFIGKGEVIKPGDMVQDENDPHLFHPASDSIGDTVENSWKPREYWITPITEGQANG